MLDEAAANGRPYDLLLTDMQMPEMHGYALARSLRQRGSTLPIIALTAHPMAEDRQKCIDAGCNDSASKPIHKAALLETFGKWIGNPVGKQAEQAAWQRRSADPNHPRHAVRSRGYRGTQADPAQHDSSAGGDAWPKPNAG